MPKNLKKTGADSSPSPTPSIVPSLMKGLGFILLLGSVTLVTCESALHSIGG